MSIALRKPGPKSLILEPQLIRLFRPLVGELQRAAPGVLEAFDFAL